MANVEGEQAILLKESSDVSQKDNRTPVAGKKGGARNQSGQSTMHWFAQIGDESNSAEGRDRDEKIRLAKERQNEERQRKIEELRSQAEAAQKYREQKEEERKRKIEELRNKDNDRRLQVEERKKAIIEAEKERRDYILRKNQERDARLDTKRRNERSSIAFAFGSSTPRLLDPVDMGSVSPSNLWGHRRSTSITNISYSGAPLTRRSSERELSDGSKKRATSAGGIDRQNEDRRSLGSSMYEIFNWDTSLVECPKSFALSIAGGEIDIDSKPSTYKSRKEDSTDSPTVSFRSVARRKTDLMPTIPSPRDSSFGSRTSVHSYTPRTPGRAVSMSRLDQLAQPIRRNGEHIRAVIERERQAQLDLMLIKSDSSSPVNFNSGTNQYARKTATRSSSANNNTKSMSRSMVNLAANRSAYNRNRYDNNNIRTSPSSSIRIQNANSRSMMHLPTIRGNAKKTSTRSITSTIKKDDTSSQTAGSRSGDVTPGGSFNTSRPGSAMSTSTTASGLVQRRHQAPQVRKPRPASIAVTGVSLNDENGKLKKDKPPLPKITSTPKRVSNNSVSLLKTSVTGDLNNKQSERKASLKKDVQKPKTPAVPTETDSNVAVSNNKKSPPKSMATSQIETKVADEEQPQLIDVRSNEEPIAHKTKEEKEAMNAESLKSNEPISITSVESSSTMILETQKVDENLATSNQTQAQPALQQQRQQPPQPPKEQVKEKQVVETNVSVSVDEKADNETEKDTIKVENDEMTASMIARKITTEEQAKAALAERRRLAREEAERQAELERQRLEMERQAEIQRQLEEEERQRKFEEETLCLAEEQRKAEEERLLLAIEEAKKREEAERQKREEDERLKAEKEEADKRAKEEAERQRIETAERLKKEEKEREERRKRVEAIMSRTRAKGNSANSTPSKENDGNKEDDKQSKSEKDDQSNEGSPSETEINENQQVVTNPISTDLQQQQEVQSVNVTQEQTNNSYEKSVTDKENSLMKSFSNMIVDESTKLYQAFPDNLDAVSNGKSIIQQNDANQENLSNSIINGNGHTEIYNKSDNLINISPAMITEQLIDFSTESQVTDRINFNNNSLIASSTTPNALVTSDSHDNKDVSLL